MYLIDTHCHFNHARLMNDVEACLERAKEEGVRQMIVVGYDLASSKQAVRQAETYGPTVFAAVGVHPHDAKMWDADAEAHLREWAEHPRVVAIGEIGLDYYHDFSPRENQFAVFRSQMQLARDLALPVIIHCREAYADTLQILREEGADETGGVMHCWAGNRAQMEETVALGLALGFGGTLTFKNAEEVRACALEAPLEQLLTETDAPYLAPMPYRGKRNEPAYVRQVAQTLALLRGISLPELARLTTGNAHRIFPKLVGEG